MDTQKTLPHPSLDAVLYFLYRDAASPWGHTIAAYRKWVTEMVIEPFEMLKAAEPEPIPTSPRLIDADEPLAGT